MKHKYIAFMILALALTVCRADQDEPQQAEPAFSFSRCNLPSLMDINERKFEKNVAGKIYQLTNVDPSFEKSFTLLRDDTTKYRTTYLIQDKQGRTLFEGDFDGIPRYVACVDIDGDNTQDVIVELAAYGNHGNGTESFEVLLNENGKLTRLKNSIQFEYIRGQENKAGELTWYSSPKFNAVFDGEEARVTGDGSENDPIVVSEIRKVKEVWGHKNGEMCVISRSSVPIGAKDVKYMTIR